MPQWSRRALFEGRGISRGPRRAASNRHTRTGAGRSRGVAMTKRDIRFGEPSERLSKPAGRSTSSTLATWTNGYIGVEPIVRGRRCGSRDNVPRRRSAPSIPSVALVEATVLAAVRPPDVRMQRVRPALAALERKTGVVHALATRQLSPMVPKSSPTSALTWSSATCSVRPSSSATGSVSLAKSYVRNWTRIEFGADDYATLSASRAIATTLRTTRSFGRPTNLRAIHSASPRFRSSYLVRSLVLGNRS